MYLKNILIATALLCSHALAYGQTTEKNQKSDTAKIVKTQILNEVIVTGNSRKDPAQVIIKEDYRTKVVQPKNSGELFSEINGFSLIKRGSYAVDPSFRASQYEQLNVQFDGGTKATHACPNRMDPITTFMNPEEVTRIEIIKGPFSVRYGNTFGGIINMVSNTANRSQKLIGGSFSSGYESNGNAAVNMLNLTSKIRKLDLLGNLSYRNYDNYKDGNGYTIPSAFKSIGYDLKAGYNFTDNQRLQANFKQNFGRDILHAGLMMDTDEDNSTIGSIDYKLISKKNKFFKGLNSHFYYSFVDHIMSNKRRKGFDVSEAISALNATVYGGKIETEFDLSNKIKIFTGIDLTNVSREGGRERIIKKNMLGVLLPTPIKYYDKIWQNSYTNTLGIFTEGKWYVTEKSMFNFGLRLDNVNSDAKDLDASYAALYPGFNKKTENNISGTISFKKTLKQNYSLEFSYGRGTRAANIEERYIAYFNIGKDPYEYIGNPNLKAEINNQFEIGFNAKENFTGFANSLKYGGSMYYSIYENYIMGIEDVTLTRKYMPATPPIYPKVFRNINNAMKTGFEVYGDLKFANNLNFVTEIAYVYTENKDLNESLPLTPPLITRLKLGYETKLFWASLSYNITSPQNKISNSFGESATSGYEIMDIKGGINPVKNLNVGFGVLNVFDKFYNNHLNYSFNNQEGFGKTPITEPGRNFTVFINYKF
jgi:iron complex outermembrane receptor protein